MLHHKLACSGEQQSSIEDGVIIAGAGIAGLATAAALQKVSSLLGSSSGHRSDRYKESIASKGRIGLCLATVQGCVN